MAQDGHTNGPTCVLHEEDDDWLQKDDNTLPPVKAQFFYISALPIDDPLSPLPSINAVTSSNTSPQPFSIRDNAALEEAWQGLQKRKTVVRDRSRPGSRALNRMFSFPKFRSGLQSSETPSPEAESSTKGMFASLPERKRSTASMRVQQTKDTPAVDTIGKMHSSKIHRKSSVRSNSSKTQSQTQAEQSVLLDQSLNDIYGVNPVDVKELQQAELESGSGQQRWNKEKQLVEPETGSMRRRRLSPLGRRSKPNNNSTEALPEATVDLGDSDAMAQLAQANSIIESDISGRPFARAPSSRQVPMLSSNVGHERSPSPDFESSPVLSRPNRSFGVDGFEEEKQIFVPVGVSKLHLVEFPTMAMKPIYWSPINDISSVVRATWFYRDTMQPVPAEVANRLEIGYEDMKPFLSTYQDELNACIENGVAAELKVVHRLWPDVRKSSRPGTAVEDKSGAQDMAANEIDEEEMPEAPENVAADPRPLKKRKLFESHSVIYVNARDAQILRPSALPSVSRNRKPLNSVRKGREIGVAVVRGFDRKVWQKSHPDPRSDAKLTQAKIGASISQSGVATTQGQRLVCAKCEQDAQKPQVSDLVLVIHGIGQKLSERVDSYHFTHAINGLRREFNVELAAETGKGSLKDHAGIMVLPVNWRLTVDFQEGQQSAENKYELKDITPETLPAVRSLISDVMLDIPYYMSHHKSKMTAAVIREANRVYQLWCKNNPGFEDYGRVHLIAHSLGSVMAMEILSNQPTFVPKDADSDPPKLNETRFDFNTTNLFCCGSPSGFFLLLNNANLVPRRGRNKAGMEGEDSGRGVGGEANQYGCLAVDNVYNICHKNDPIAYQLNACVDSDYASSLQLVTVPSATQSLFGKIGSSLRWAGSSAYDAYGYVGATARPVVQHMPSTVEMETHNFTREEIAERRMYLLNDNGQIDYFLNSGGGPLEIQYLNMLSAHSSYWYLKDFVRFLVVECCRQPGRANTLPALRAVKKREYKKGVIA